MLTSIAPSFMNQFGNWLKRLTQMENPWKHLCPVVPQNQSVLHICPSPPSHFGLQFSWNKGWKYSFQISTLYSSLYSYIVTSISILGWEERNNSIPQGQLWIIFFLEDGRNFKFKLSQTICTWPWSFHHISLLSHIALLFPLNECEVI